MTDAGKMRFRRILYRTLRYLIELIGLAAGLKLMVFINDQRKEKKIAEQREKHRRDVAGTVITCLCTTAAVIGSAVIGIRHIKHRRGGYLIDLFDRDEYDAVDPDHEEEVEKKIRAELRGNDDNPPKHRQRPAIPVEDGEDGAF